MMTGNTLLWADRTLQPDSLESLTYSQSFPAETVTDSQQLFAPSYLMDTRR